MLCSNVSNDLYDIDVLQKRLTWFDFEQDVIDAAIDQWRHRLRSCVWWWTLWTHAVTWMFITGSIARSANLPVFSLVRGRFWGLSPRRGDTLHRWGWNLEGPLLRAKFHRHRCNDKGVGPPKLKFLLRFDRNLEYKRPAGAYPLRDFHKICSVCTAFQDALGVKIWLDLLKGLRSYGGFKLRGSGFPQIFSAP